MKNGTLCDVYFEVPWISFAVLDTYAADEGLVDKPVSQPCAQRSTLLRRLAMVFGKKADGTKGTSVG